MTADIRSKLILTADDYGIRETSRPILHLAREGKLDRVAVLIHFTTPEEAADLLETGVKIDLHLELIDFLKSGTNVRGSAFFRGMSFTWRYLTGQVTARHAEEQWQVQIERFRELFGRLPDGLNSHEHIHYFPKFFRVFLGLAEQYGIGYVRFGRQGMFNHTNTFVGRILSVLWRRTRDMHAKMPLPTSDYMMSLDWLSDPKRFFETVPAGTVELVVHPEREDEYRLIREYF